jgi:HK97 family phage prohead protease
MIERRFVKGAEVRAKKKGEGDKATPALEGYAAVFGEDYVLYESKSFRAIERVKPGAFSRAIEEKQDVRCCFNHNPDNVLARTTNKTLTLEQDKKGLRFEADLDSRTHIAQDVLCFVERGDVTGCSFAFSVRKQNWTETEEDGFTTYTREIEDLDLFEQGPVLFPAYIGTSVGARSTPALLSAELRSAAWAEGLPAEIRSKLVARAKKKEDAPECNCRCVACARDNDCDGCVDNMVDCGDEENCRCMDKRSATPSSDNLIDFDRARMQADVEARVRRLGLPQPEPTPAS